MKLILPVLFYLIISIIGYNSIGQTHQVSRMSTVVTILHPINLTDSNNNKRSCDITSEIKKYYALALQYKNGDGVPIDYNQAFSYFSKAAALGDAQSAYALGYMHYKGLGTRQDYAAATELFRQGAYLGRDNSMYFYGLSWRNGYGLEQNEDSAQYWLKKSAALGYKQAALELQAKAPENSNVQAVKLIQKIHNAAVPEQVPLNQFIAVKPQQPDSSIIAGNYEGYVIQYDWSGKYPVSTNVLSLTLSSAGEEASSQTATGYSFTGQWKEEAADTATTIHASLQKDSLVFVNTHYSRKDHYSVNKAVTYNFQNAALNLVRKGDSVYLAGNIYMFSPDRKEPSKPLFVALARTADVGNTNSSLVRTQISSANDSADKKTVQLLNVYPNPFRTYVNVQFKVNKSGKVGMELYNMSGQKVYEKQLEFLNIGLYTIRVEPSSTLFAQTYLLRLVFEGNNQQIVKVIKI